MTATDARCSDGDSRIRNEQVLVRLTPAEAADARRLAEANALSLPALMRAGLHLLLTTETVDA